MYRCGKCKKSVKLKSEEPTRCPFCGYKILFKERPKIVKRVTVE
ncbi:MAG: DNA-directed RNA polymerase subunit P [Candidatus Hydrothermarchaeota archaeon]|jgi:DNA-directed RNA polymerase subunit P|nr:DNA-directed RNA polymerase subunit P [Candidatus Hydrothermarchaeota archaeon]MDP6612611.1 DNA-directed RNA polymerase subunit P [Candidatus Hydrothermarchaeota archaeon]